MTTSSEATLAECPVECRVGQRIKRYLRQLAPHQNERECPQLLREALAEIERAQTVVEAARCIHHWHDSGNDGMVVSGEHVRALWQALHDLDEVPNAKSQATDAALSRQVACTDGLGVAVPPAPTFEQGD